MITNTMVLVVVAAFAALVLASMLALVAYRTRTQKRRGKGETIRDQAQACSLQNQATSYRSEAVTSRDQLNELMVHRLAG